MRVDDHLCKRLILDSHCVLRQLVVAGESGVLRRVATGESVL